MILTLIFLSACSTLPAPAATQTPQPTATINVNCSEYFESINPSIIINKYDFSSVRSLVLKKSKSCPQEAFENKSISIFLNGEKLPSSKPFVDQMKENSSSLGTYIRLDYDKYQFPDTEYFTVTVNDAQGSTLFDAEIPNIAKMGIFKIPTFVNTRTKVTNPDILNKFEIRVYHVDSIEYPGGRISSSFNINDVKDYKDVCAKPDGIHPEFLHRNAIDYGKCEWGPKSTIYDIYYSGIYPMIVNKISEDIGMTVRLDFDYNKIKNPPIFYIDYENGHLIPYYMHLIFAHLVEVNVSEGDLVSQNQLIGSIGKFRNSTELHEERGLAREQHGASLSRENYPPIPYKLTLSDFEGNWIESLINTYNAK